MQHLQVKAAATTTDQGAFSAIAAAYSVDRVNEQIVPGAFGKTIEAWSSNGRTIPLHWDHESGPENVIGSVDPTSMRETKDGLYVEGQLDLENSEVAREAWRSMKNNALALSFGYLATQTKREGEVTQLLEIDLFEISIVSAPANNDTRVLSLKSALADVEHAERVEEAESFKSIEEVQAFLDEKFPGHQISSSQEKSDLRKRSFDAALETANDFKTPQKVEPEVEPEPDPEPEPIKSAELRRMSERAVIDAALL